VAQVPVSPGASDIPPALSARLPHVTVRVAPGFGVRPEHVWWKDLTGPRLDQRQSAYTHYNFLNQLNKVLFIKEKIVAVNVVGTTCDPWRHVDRPVFAAPATIAAIEDLATGRENYPPVPVCDGLGLGRLVIGFSQKQSG
jgi:hypothetical protein